MVQLDEDGGGSQVFRVAKQMAREAQDASGATCIKDEASNIAADPEEVETIWKGYFEHQMNMEHKWDDVVSKIVEEPKSRIARHEVKKVLKQAKSGKAVSPSGLAVMILAAG